MGHEMTGGQKRFQRAHNRRTASLPRVALDDRDRFLAGEILPIRPAGIDIDVPVSPGSSQCTPESVKNTVMAAFKGGATGVILSRNYPEMNPEHLAGAGAALDELGLR